MSWFDEGYNLEFEERPQYLYAHVAAPRVDRDIAMNYLTKVANRCREIGARKLMIYRDIPEMLDDATLFFVTTEFLDMIRGIRAAFINPYLENNETFEFSMTVGNNRGAIYRLFDSAAEGEKWLLE